VIHYGGSLRPKNQHGISGTGFSAILPTPFGAQEKDQSRKVNAPDIGGSDSLDTSDQSFGEEPDCGEEKSVQCEEGEERTEFMGLFHGVLGGETKQWRIRKDGEPNSRVRRPSKADRQKW
jgi:hypothetical protein